MRGRVFPFIDKESFGSFENMLEAQDFVEDLLNAALAFENKYYCDFCQEYFQEVDVQHRIEDNTFTAPFGSTLTMGGSIGSVAVCPVCRDNDLEECE